MRKIVKRIDKLLFGGALLRRRIDRSNWSDELSVSDGLAFRFAVHYQKNANDPLAALCDKYGSDKGELKSTGHPYSWPSHNYTDYYSRLFSHCRTHIRRVFECGLGTNNPNMASSMGVNARPGASLRVWRDYFPNASVFGGDIDREILFEEERIRTYHLDQLDGKSIAAFWSAVDVRDFDLMIDDGLHTFEAGSSLFTHSVQHLSTDGIYIIEDVAVSDLLLYKDFFSKAPFLADYVTLSRPNQKLKNNNLVVIRRRAPSISDHPRP